MLKSDGFRLDECQTTAAWRLSDLATLALLGAIRIIQLVDARDGSERPASDVANQVEITAVEAIGSTLEGKTAKPRNPHPQRLSWIVCGFGGWHCYYKPPSPKTMARGWDKLAAVAQGFTLASGWRVNARIP
jgi:hypothetical protein